MLSGKLQVKSARRFRCIVLLHRGIPRRGTARHSDSRRRVDYHAHPGGTVSVDQAIEFATRRGVRFGLVQHAGNRQQNHDWGLVSNDDELDQCIRSLEGKPVFKGIQAEYKTWRACFSKRSLARLDYILTDTLTMPGDGGRLIHIWTPEFHCNDAPKWMDR